MCLAFKNKTATTTTIAQSPFLLVVANDVFVLREGFQKPLQGGLPRWQEHFCTSLLVFAWYAEARAGVLAAY